MKQPHPGRLAVAVCLIAATAPAQSAVFPFSGTARAPGGDYLYTEYHEVAGSCEGGVWVPGRHHVAYRKGPDEKAIANKSLEYRESLLRPIVEFAQPEFEETLNITPGEDDNVTVQWQTPQGGKRTFTIELRPDMVIDAGFNHLVMESWDRITGGESVEFRFLAPTKGEHYAFILEPASDSRIQADHIFRIKPAGFIAGFLVDPIILGYDKDGFITDYLGVSNIRKSVDEFHTAHISYEFTALPDCSLIP